MKGRMIKISNMAKCNISSHRLRFFDKDETCDKTTLQQSTVVVLQGCPDLQILFSTFHFISGNDYTKLLIPMNHQL